MISGSWAATCGMVVVVGLVAVGCATDQEQPAWVEEIQTGSAEVEIEAGSSVPDPSPTSAPISDGDSPGPDGAPSVDATGDDFERIWREMQAFESWMLANPDPVHASEHYVDGTEIHASVVDLLTSLSERNVVMEVGDYSIVGLEVVDADAEVAHLRYEDRRSYAEEMDAVTGEVVSREDYDGRSWIWDLVLRADADGRWRVESIEFVEYGSET